MVSHLSSEVLRRYIDDPTVLLSYEKEHLLQCARCRARLEKYRENAQVSAGALAGNDRYDTALARRMLSPRLKEADVSQAHYDPSMRERPFETAINPAGTRWAAALVALVVVAFLFANSPLHIYAQNFLTIFEPQQFHGVGLTTADITKLRALPDLQSFGTMRGPAHPHFADFTDGRKAAAVSGMVIAQPQYLPASVPAQRTYHVSKGASASFTFSAAKARAYARRKAITLPPMTAALDGATLTASVGPIMVEVAGRQRANGVRRARMRLPADTVVITQAHAAKVVSSRASVDQIESYLLSIPGVPPDLAAQIRSIRNIDQTLPVPPRVLKTRNPFGLLLVIVSPWLIAYPVT